MKTEVNYALSPKDVFRNVVMKTVNEITCAIENSFMDGSTDWVFAGSEADRSFVEIIVAELNNADYSALILEDLDNSILIKVSWDLPDIIDGYDV